MFLKPFYGRIAKDLKQKKLIPLKILFFVHASTIFVLYPYLTIHMRELGISVEETAIMSAVTPVVSIVMPPVAGMLADKIGNFKLLLAMSSMLGGASALLLLLVPVGRVIVTFPARAEFALSCPGDALDLTVNQEYPCKPLHPFAYDVEMRLETCGYICHTSDSTITNSSYGHLLREASVYEVHDGSKGTPTRPYKLNIEDAPAFYDESRSRVLRNPRHYNRTLRRISNGAFFFPTPDRLRFGCDFPSNNEEIADAETFADTNDTCFFSSEMKPLNELVLKKFHVKIAPVWGVGEKSGDVETFTVNSLTDGKMVGNSTITHDVVVNEEDEVSCRNAIAEAVSVSVQLRDGGVVSLQGCAAACIASAPRPKVCTETTRQIEFNPGLTFWTYLAVRVFNSIIGGTAFAMFEGAVIAILREQRADYGLQRIYGSVGGIISSPLSGMLIDYASQGKAYTDFRPAFYLYTGLKMASGVLMLTINLKFKQPSQHVVRDVLTVLRNVEMVALFIACFVMGTAWGYIESFLFWLLQDLGASRSLMGVTVAVGGVAGLPLLVMSGPIIRRLGHANVIFIGFVFYAVRLLGYSLIYNPWLCLVFEAMESLTSALAFTAAVTYAARLSTGTTDTSVQGLLGGLYYGVGKGSGSLIGGYLMKAVGTRPTYQIFSAATLTTGCIYFLFNRFYLRQRAELNTIGDDVWKKPPKEVKTNKSKTESDEKTLNSNVTSYIEILENAPKCQVTSAADEDVDETKKHDTDSADTTRIIEKKSGIDSTDGGSDSGVDNPAFIETESETHTPVDEKKVIESTQKTVPNEKQL